MKEFLYKISVIIPVYNMEATLSKTMESLFQQTLQQHLFEIILIDDGSKDGSSVICDTYAHKCSNVRVLHQENAGVSAARNAGIRVARGKYLMYLDGDDSLSPESLENISEFFDLHYYEIDLITYPLKYYYKNGRVNGHWRYNEVLTETGIYSLEEYPYICQTTINVCVKNCEQNLFFDTTIELGEDQVYTTKILSNQAKIGFVKEALYKYMRYESSNSYMRYPPYYSFNAYNNIHKRHLEIAKMNKKMRRYCENLVLYDIAWRFSSNMLLPIHLRGQEYDNAMHSFVDILDQIPNQLILKYPHMHNLYKWYLLSLKRHNRPFVCWEKDKLCVIDNTGTLYEQNAIQIVLCQLYIKNDNLCILGYINGYSFFFHEYEPSLTMNSDGGEFFKIPVTLSEIGKLNRHFRFQCRIPLTKVQTITFKVGIHEIEYPSNFWYANKLNVHPGLYCNYIYGNLYSAVFYENRIEIVKTKSRQMKKAVKIFENMLYKNCREQWWIRKFIKALKKTRIWLYNDSHDSIDNGYYQFIHDFGIHDGIRRYYVYHEDSTEIISGRFSAKYKHYLIPFGSNQHKFLFAAASKILTSFFAKSTYLPYPEKTRKLYEDLFQYEVVYLQHGVMHAKLSNLISKEQVWQIDRIVVSTNFEEENFIKLGYRREDILTCGMPRLDTLILKETKEKRILFAASWRKYLVKTVNGVGLPQDNFYASEYYKKFSSFLNSDFLNDFLEMNDCYIDVQIHPMFSCYTEGFLKKESKRIQMIKSVNISEYVMCITDFSSIMFDFIYLNKPVVSFFPDRTLFDAGLHTYQDFYFPLEDGFTIYCETVEKAMQAMERLVKNDFRLPDSIQKKADNLYFSRNPDHAEKLYQVLKGE